MTLFYDEYIYFAITIFLRARTKVFVPLSGLVSVNAIWSNIEWWDNVFVPLSGLASVNGNAIHARDAGLLFSSPYRG